MKASQLLSAFACFFFISACAGPGAFNGSIDSASADNTDSSANTPITEEAPLTVTAITLSQTDSLTLTTGETVLLWLTITYSDGSSTVTQAGSSSTDGTSAILWFSNNSAIASISSIGILNAVSSGSTTIKASVGTKSDTLNVTVTQSETTAETASVESEPLEITNLSFATKPLSQAKTESLQLLFNTALDDEEPNELTVEQLQQTTDCEPHLKLSNDSVAKLENNSLVPTAYGIVSITVQCKGLSDTWTVLITAASGVSVSDDAAESTDHTTDDETETADEEEIPETISYTREDANDPDQAFLQLDDTFIFTPGDDASYGHDTFPDNILGLPSATKADVVSFGTSGEIIIELKTYILIDDTGPDFIVFENAFTGWTERAQVAVSEDGVTYFAFACDAFDAEGVYAGCAGVTPINYSDDPDVMLDPDAAGGDIFDLAELGIEKVNFIKITDMATCTNPALCSSGSGGFDFDGLAIVNGINQ